MENPIPNGKGLVNNGLEVEEPLQTNVPRFRIKTVDDSVDAPAQEKTVAKDSGTAMVDDVVTSLPNVTEKSSDGPTKHVHLNLPTDYNESIQNNRTHTNTQTMGYLTHDAVPLSVFYRNQESMENLAGDKRPTLDQLHKGQGLEYAKKRHWVRSFYLYGIKKLNHWQSTVGLFHPHYS